MLKIVQTVSMERASATADPPKSGRVYEVHDLQERCPMTSTKSSCPPEPRSAVSWRDIWEGVQNGRRVVVPTPDGVVVCLSENTYIELLARAEPQPSHRDTPQRAVPHLTNRELQVMRAVQAGGTGPQIADQMGVADNTIAQHLHSVRAKYGVSSTARALLAAERDGLL